MRGSPNGLLEQATPASLQPVPHGEAAVGGRLLVRFNPTGEMFGGEVLAWREDQGQHHVLYDDGEEEWVDLSTETGLVWQGAQRGNSVSPGIPEGAFPSLLVSRLLTCTAWRQGRRWQLV